MPQFYKQTRPQDAIVFGVGVVVIIFIFTIINIVKKRSHSPVLNSESGRGVSSPKHFSGFALHRIAANMGLDKEQTKMLEFVLKSDGVADIEHSLNNSNLLDRHFKRAYRLIEQNANTEEEAQNRLAILFSIRNILENSGGAGGGVTSTRQIPENTAAVLTVGDGSYPVKVLSTKGENLVVENPYNALGSPIRLPRGGKATLAFFTRSSKGFAFETRIMGISDSGDKPVLQLIHSSQRKQLSQRRFRRRQEIISCGLFLVKVEDTGRKKAKKMIVDKRQIRGTIMDISLGGCSIKANAAIPSGTLLKINFDHSGFMSVAVLGQVLRTNRSGVSIVMHIKFLRIPRKSMNAINTIVFDYSDD
ncbi:MAG: PilZ domain-containing protein [Treponema sp.]|jgi:c-di-GMP-binding flagellar brake protein YcgR|nr:PilZ domain-containing protein [Treponema sp.]